MTVLTSVVRIYREQQGDRPFSEILIMTDVAGNYGFIMIIRQDLEKSLVYALIR